MSSEIEQVEKEEIKDEERNNKEKESAWKRWSSSKLLAWWSAGLDSTRGDMINHNRDNGSSGSLYMINPHKNRFLAITKFIYLFIFCVCTCVCVCYS